MHESRTRTPAPHGPSRAAVAASWLAVAAVAALVFLMSSRDADALDHGSGIVSLAKAWLAGVAAGVAGRPVDVSPVGHALEFCALGAALVNALRWHVAPGRAWRLAALLSSAYGACDELHQLLMPGRSCDAADWLVDTVAAALGAAIVYALLVRHARDAGGGRPCPRSATTT